MKYIDNGGDDPSQVLGAWIEQIEPDSVRGLRFQTGFFSSKGLPWLIPTLNSLRDRGRPVTALIGSNDTGTGVKHVRTLVELLGLPRDSARLGVCAFGKGFFHPKVIHLVLPHARQLAYVGSANLTEQGVGGLHVEAGVLLDTADGDPASELTRIAEAIDAWFVGPRAGLHIVPSLDVVDDLLVAGVLAGDGTGAEWAGPRRKNSKGETPSLPNRKLLHKPKPTTPAKETKETNPTDGSPAASPGPGSGVPQSYFLMELSKNRISKGSYQADVGKIAYEDFFSGSIDEEVFLDIETIRPDGVSAGTRERKLVYSSTSKNYRVEIAFPGTYPAEAPPIVVFGRKDASSYAAMLLRPSDAAHAEASKVLEAHKLPGTRKGSMRRAFVSEKQLRNGWPKCPMLS